MRLIFTCTVAIALVASVPILQAEDPPQGSIGVQVKLDGGKIVVVEPLKGAPAEKAGIKAGDVILKINDFKVKDEVEPDDLEATVKEIVKHKPGEKIKLGIKRGDKEMTIEVTVAKRSDIFKDKDKNKDQ